MRKLCSFARLLLSYVCVVGALGTFAFTAACGGASSASAPPSAAPPAPQDHAKHHQDHAGHHPGPASLAGHAPAAGGHTHHDGDPGGHHANREGGMTHDFKGAEKWAAIFDDPARDEWQRPDEVAALLQVKPGMTVADLGAGTGYFVGRLSAAAGPKGQVIATDLEPDMVRYLEERARRQGWKNVRAIVVPGDDPGLAATSVDRVLVVDVWHHIGERRAFAAKIGAALRPGGRIAIVDFDLSARRGPPAKYRLAPDAIMEDLRSAGLTVELATESLPDQYIVIGTKR